MEVEAPTPDVRTEAGLIQFIHGMWPDFTITPENLRKPTEEFVLNFCVKWLTQFQPRIEILFEMSQEQKNLTENPEIFMCCIHIMNIHKIAMRYLSALKCSNVQGILDFISPTSKITRGIGSFALNFTAFQNMFLDEYYSKMELVDEKRNKNQKIKDEIARLETLLHNKRLAKIEKWPKKIMIEEKNVTVEEEIKKLSNVKSHLSQKVSGARVKHDAAKRIYEEFMMQCQKLEAKNVDLKKQLIDYPHYQQKLETAQEKTKELDSKIEETQGINKLRENSMQTIENLHNIYGKCLEKVCNVDVLKDEISVFKKKIKSEEEMIEKMSKDMKDKELKINIVKNIILKIKDDLADNKTSTIIKEEIKKGDYLSKKLEQLQLQQETLKSQYDELQAKKLKEIKKLQELKNKYNVKKDFITTYYRKILEQNVRTFEEKKESIKEAVTMVQKKLEGNENPETE